MLKILKKVKEEVRQSRLQKCNNCPNLFKPTRNCKICICWVDWKTKYEEQFCPIGKW
jgi:hypothetical protein